MADFGKYIAGALALGVGWFVWSKRMPSVQIGDEVTVPANKLLLGNQPTPLANMVPGTPIALRVDFVEAGQVRGAAVGLVDPSNASRILRAPVPIGAGPFGFSQGDITGVWRNDQKIV